MAIDSGATAWILAATALVMIMTPGVGFFYGGLVRRKNLISMITLSFVAFALVSIQWVLFGYSLAFGPDALTALRQHAWPGNVRELQNEIERLVLLSETEKEIGSELLSDHIRQRHRPSLLSNGDLKSAIRDLEDEMIKDALARFDQNKSRTARALGISRQSLLEKLRLVS